MHELSVAYSPGVLASPRLRVAATAASEWLKQQIGLSLDAVSAEWDTAADASGNDVLVLKLRDFASQVSGVFKPDEFDSRNEVEWRLRRLYQELLRNRTHTLLARWNSSSDSGEE